jgi:putative MATE family efflux protein
MRSSSHPLDKTQIPIAVLVLPMFIENIIRTSMLSVDQLMLYAFSEKAVAALGVVNQMAFFVQIIYTMVAIGTSIPIAQNLGANNRREAGLFGLASFALVGTLAVLMSCVVVLVAAPVLSLYPLEDDVRQYAWQFLTIYGAGSIFIALNLLQSNILRAHGHSKDPMATNILALVLTIVGNYVCLFGPFGLPILGVAGVACSNVLSQFVAFWIMGWQIRRRKDINLPWKSFFLVPARIYRKILEVGVPTAGENLSYNIGQILIGRIIAQMGTSALAAYTLVLTLSRYVFIAGVSIGAGTQIRVGYFVGADRASEAYRKVYKYTAAGIGIYSGPTGLDRDVSLSA